MLASLTPKICVMEQFRFTFQLSRKEIFEVAIYGDGCLATSAAVFNQPKTDFSRCGQCQEDVTKGHRAARRFYKKWDPFHLRKLTPEQYQELAADINVLKERYNWCDGDGWYNQRRLSMMKPKN